MRVTFLIAAAFGLVVVAPLASAQTGPVTSGWGVRATAGTVSSCPSFCTGEFEFDSGGGEFVLNAFASETSYGTARSEGFYDSLSTYLPTLKAYAAANASSGADATVTGIQAYSYDGIGAKNFVIDFTLDAQISQGSGSPDTDALARVAVYFDNSGDFQTSFSTLVFESDATILDNESVFLDASGTVSGSVAFTVNPGDNFYVAAQLGVDSERGGIADAENTFTAAFVDSGGLTPVAVAAVPEPNSATLLALGLTVLCGRRRRD